MLLLYSLNLGSGSSGPPLDLSNVDPEQAAAIVITSDPFDIDPEQTTLLS